MKLIFYVITIALFAMPSFSAVKYECNKQCVIITKGISDKPTGDLNCTLPSPNAKMRITALDVFESDGTTLKTYFENKETVCDVLGWMDEGAKKLARATSPLVACIV